MTRIVMPESIQRQRCFSTRRRNPPVSPFFKAGYEDLHEQQSAWSFINIGELSLEHLEEQ